jgi:molybdopterin-guanine dinucleotide biosynthesis protein MobB
VEISQEKSEPKVLAVVGRSGVGKTTLLERLIPLLRANRVTVATVKHTHHVVDLDRPGTDTSRHLQAGAQRTALSGPGFCVAWFSGEADPLELAKVVGGGCHLVILEGYKNGPFLRIEVVRDLAPVLEPGEAWLTVTSDEYRMVAERILEMLETL